MTPSLKGTTTFQRLGGKQLAGVILTAASLAYSNGASAQTDGSAPAPFSGGVTLTSNYVFRGITQSDDGPAVQGGFDYEADRVLPGLWAGVWASSVEFGDNTSVEIDYYAGVSPSWENFNFDIGVIYYTYPDAANEPEQNFIELQSGVSTTLQGDVDVGVSAAWSPNFYGEIGPAWYPALDVSVPFAEVFSASVHYGYQSYSDDADASYSDYSLSVTASFEGFGFTLGYSDTSNEAGDENDTVFVSVGRSF